MTTIRIDVTKNPQLLDLGLQKENNVRFIEFDCNPWIADYGEGVAVIYAQRKGDENPYPVPLVMEDGIATWTVSSTDNAVNGKGKAQLEYIVGDAVKETKIYPTLVSKSLGAAGEDPPDPYDTWLDTLGGYTANIMQSVGQVEDLVEDATAAKNAAEEARDDTQNLYDLADDAKTAAELAQTRAELAQAAAEQALDAAQTAQENAEGFADEAESHAQNSQSYANQSYAESLTSEAYARGTRNGVAVVSTDVAYENNAKFYAEQAGSERALAVAAKNGAETAMGNAQTYANNAQVSATNAQGYAQDAQAALTNSGIIDMTIDNRGHLIYTKTDVVAVDFDLDSRGHLIVS